MPFFTKIQVIKMIRDMNPDLGLKEAKRVVDRYELSQFEKRVTIALNSVEALNELQSYARLFVRLENEGYAEDCENNSRPYENSICDCTDCVQEREVSTDPCVEPVYRDYYSTAKNNSTFWSKATGIEVMDPDGWDRKNYESSWDEPIVRDEFINRAIRSTCVKWPRPLLDEA
jgi:hypothetical protein